VNDNRTNTLVVRTPEGIEFSLLLAGPVVRFLAWVVDLACVSTVMMLIGGILKLASVLSLDVGMALLVLVNFLVTVGYVILMEWLWRGQTLGKKLLRLRVMDEQGLHLQFSQVMVRNLLRVVDSLPLCYLVGGLSCLLSGRSQRLGDIAANTIVVRTPELFTPDLDRLPGEKYNSLREYPHLAARLRQKIAGPDAAIAVRALMRRNELDAAARVELFGELAAHFRTLVRFPAEAVEGMSDERFVRNVVEIVYARRPSGGAEHPPR
jgi:uncharacterized RDD family membrane protein YckC